MKKSMQEFSYSSSLYFSNRRLTYKLLKDEIKRRIKQKRYTVKRTLLNREYNLNSLNNSFKKFIFQLVFNNIDYSSHKKWTKYKYFTQEKWTKRLLSNTKSLSLGIFPQETITTGIKVKDFQNEKLECSILTSPNVLNKNTPTFSQCLRKQEYFQITNWINNKGAIGTYFQIRMFNPYSKTPPIFKNKKILYQLPSKIKEIKKIDKETSILILNIKKEIWNSQHKFFNTKQVYIGNLYNRTKIGFIIGVQGIPVLLHKTKLNLSRKEMRQQKYTKCLYPSKCLEGNLEEIFARKRHLGIVLTTNLQFEKENSHKNYFLLKRYFTINKM